MTMSISQSVSRAVDFQNGKPYLDIVSNAAATLTVSDSGKMFGNIGASARVDYTLPKPRIGLRFTFFCDDTDGIRAIAPASTTIKLGAAVTAAAGRIDSTAIGSSVTIEAISLTEYLATTIVGTWSTT